VIAIDNPTPPAFPLEGEPHLFHESESPGVVESADQHCRGALEILERRPVLAQQFERCALRLDQPGQPRERYRIPPGNV
jgi:hypothetical protein